ncbi:uncharacterized protein LOC110985789 isoform X2 [Acanthaster planci]|uniref:Uncharacterized protein LOC110985789 isoform X2 n=1 Tax=Acanthaster planci TaxID=133434 RepID=A0A8B7ZCT6_ACAPL|nr:uncharacterized protein LOC110985789 isoform X2 [Acanthaster planci]XP_022102798.1 uncharacterized protein LOC110985789 isoform X2 [Acanthaster planci]XP_022102799.1 uncharacterized protein LOC110985789 isoform X2 [Acanthaster planci]
MAHQRLQAQWQRLVAFNQCQDSVQSNEWWIRLRNHYSEGARQYHTLEHIDNMFSLYEENRKKLTSAEEVGWAIVFHDVIYNPKARDNEDQSAELFQTFASECLPESPSSMTQRVKELILMTKTHHTEAHQVPNMYGEGDEHYFLDFDMQVLGWSSDDYDVYAQQIRQEYIHVPEQFYCSARAQVLRTFLKTANIYATREFRDLYEVQARANIEREIERLEGS